MNHRTFLDDFCDWRQGHGQTKELIMSSTILWFNFQERVAKMLNVHPSNLQLQYCLSNVASKSLPFCQIRTEISNYTGDKISVGVARPSHVLGQSVPCDRWHSILGTRVQHMCTESGIRAQGLITRVTASWQLTDNTGIRSTQLTLLLMRSMCSWLITPCAVASTQYSY